MPAALAPCPSCGADVAEGEPHTDTPAPRTVGVALALVVGDGMTDADVSDWITELLALGALEVRALEVHDDPSVVLGDFADELD